MKGKQPSKSSSEPHSSEAVLDSKLHDAWVAGLGIDLAERAGIQTDIGVAPVEIVEQVERLDAKLHRPGAERQHPGDRHVDFPEPGTFKGPRGFVAQRSRRRNGKGRRVEEVRQRLVA